MRQQKNAACPVIKFISKPKYFKYFHYYFVIVSPSTSLFDKQRSCLSPAFIHIAWCRIAPLVRMENSKRSHMVRRQRTLQVNALWEHARMLLCGHDEIVSNIYEAYRRLGLRSHSPAACTLCMREHVAHSLSLTAGLCWWTSIHFPRKINDVKYSREQKHNLYCAHSLTCCVILFTSNACYLCLSWFLCAHVCECVRALSFFFCESFAAADSKRCVNSSA